MPKKMPRILFVSGFSSYTRAKDLAFEFERYGPLVRCDVPATRNPNASPYAFVEFRYERDAEDAYHDMHGARIDDRRITVQWAKNPPSAIWRLEPGGGRRGSPPRDRGRDRRRSSRSRSPGRRDDRDRRDDDRDRKGDRDRRDDRRDRRDRDRDVDGDRRDGKVDGADKKMDVDAAEPRDEIRADDRDKALTPPYDN